MTIGVNQVDILQRAEAAKRLAPLATRLLIGDLLKAAGLFQVAEPAPEPEPEATEQEEPASDPVTDDVGSEDDTERPADGVE